MLALYRKYRPKKLSDIVGEEQVIKPLESALKSGKISHSYLFTGPRGCGKTSVARILAHEVNGFKYELEDSYLDIIEIDAASNTGVDNIRDLREKAIIAPSEGKFKVYIVDEVHMLSKSAFNALLKTLEEPPEHVIFILATTDLEKVPITITSRSQVFTFRLAPPEIMLPHLKTVCEQEKINITDDALRLICQKGGGSFRDSLSLLDQISSLAEQNQQISEQTVADCLGLPMDAKLSTLLDAYVSGNFTAITAQLKSLLEEGIKPESIATSTLNRIIKAPEPALIPLLGELPKVTAPYPEAKLLSAFLNESRTSEDGTTVTKASRRGERCSSSGAFPPATAATYIPDDADRSAQRAVLPDAQRMTSQTESGDPDKSARPQALEAETNKTEFPKAKETVDHKSQRKTTLTPALDQQLKKCKIIETDEKIDIYPPKKIIKTILERPANSNILKSNFDKPFIIHNPDDFEKSPEIAQISDIMGNVQEVNNENGGIPF